MNNFFLYAVRASETFRAVEHFLGKMKLAGKLVTLPPGSQFTSPLCLQMRSNDILILFAHNEEDITHLLTQRDEYECFRILLIRTNKPLTADSKQSLLTPRFVFYLDSNMDDLYEYLNNILNNNR
jgi:hypothetical protein